MKPTGVKQLTKKKKKRVRPVQEHTFDNEKVTVV